MYLKIKINVSAASICSIWIFIKFVLYQVFYIVELKVFCIAMSVLYEDFQLHINESLFILSVSPRHNEPWLYCPSYVSKLSLLVPYPFLLVTSLKKFLKRSLIVKFYYNPSFRLPIYSLLSWSVVTHLAQ